MRPVHFLVLIIVLLLLFGASKLPDLARSIGQSAKILRNELKEVREEDAPARVPGVTDHPVAPAAPSTSSEETPSTPSSQQ